MSSERIMLVTCALLLTQAACATERGEVVPLWAGAAPGSEGVHDPEVYAPADAKLPMRFDVVHYPAMYVFLPPKEKANGMAVVVAPGGGHFWLNMKADGWPIAEWLNQQGIAAFVVKYRLARAKDSHYTILGDEMPDMLRAVRLVRSRAQEWGIDSHKVGIMGLSAGGEVAALAETHFDAGDPSSPDPVARVSSRPDFSILVYPGDAAGPITAVPKDTPPTFLVCTDEDRIHAVTTAEFYLQLQKQSIPAEMHIYASGGHGFAMKPLKLPVAAWPDALRIWFIDRKLMPS